ncbi:MAG TPA: alpha-glucan family phosphorylase, partial [Nitriliruptorales bacterium]
MSQHPFPQGAAATDAAVARLAARLPEPLGLLAGLAYNYHWSWVPGGRDIFKALDADRWRRVQANPVRFLTELEPAQLELAATDTGLATRIQAVAAAVRADLDRPFQDGLQADGAHPIAYVCAEFGVHPSLQIYSGGLGILAGDILKESSDLALPTVGVGLLYRRGYFHQRLDASGWQHEYWTEVDPDLLPAVHVTGADGAPVRVTVPVRDREVALHVWRVDVGRVPLFLLDADLEDNDPLDRWITSRLYDGNLDVRLAQYTVLGVGAIRALRALGIEPGTVHLNEGHGALATLELTADQLGQERDLQDVLAAARGRVVFTTHTPVPAGNETYEPYRVTATIGAYLHDLQVRQDQFLALGRVDPDDHHAEVGMTPVALRAARTSNAVSARHGEVARDMWSDLFGTQPADTPITHVTNGVHLPTWMAPQIRAVLDEHLGDGWWTRADDPDTWAPVDDIPDDELWRARTQARAELIDHVHDRILTDRLARGDDLLYVERAAEALDPHALTIGFARRVATYKRLHLLRHDPERVLKLLDAPHPLQLLFAGKAHPSDTGAKGVLQSMFGLKDQPNVAERVAFLEDYDMTLGRLLTSGTDVWVNVPRPPMEASGTSGMKAGLSGGLNLSVLDGWWAEGYDATNGWGIDGSEDPDHEAQDHRHATELYDLLEHQVIPLFHERDEDGIPRGWMVMV